VKSAVELLVETRRHSDATCISETLAGSGVTRTPRGWTVTVAANAGDLVGLLTALQACLDGNSLPPVTVAVDDRSYRMEPQTA
jgi:hypothetical protein